MNFKNIHIGNLIKMRVEESGVDEDRIINFFKFPVTKIEAMYEEEEISTEYLMRWSKLLEYDFFRLYSHHLILYSPPAKGLKANKGNTESSLPIFRKNIYSQELISFILEQIENKVMTRNEVIKEYGIPKSTLWKWDIKYSIKEKNEG